MTMSDFLTQAGARMAPFERLRVGRLGCAVSLAGIAFAIAALAVGWKETGGSWGAGFRFVVLTGLGSVLALYLIYALVETLVERSVRSSLDLFLRESGTDLETLVKAAEVRRSSLRGGGRLLQLLKERARTDR